MYLIHMYICKYKYDHDMSFHLMVILRSTTSPNGRPIIEVAYEEMIFSVYRGCMGDDSLRRVVRVLAWCIIHVWHTRVNTSVGSIYIFSVFSRYKNIYVLCFQIFMYYKRALVDSDLVLAWWGSENIFDRPWVFQNRNWTTDDFMTYIVYEFYE